MKDGGELELPLQHGADPGPEVDQLVDRSAGGRDWSLLPGNESAIFCSERESR